MTEDVFLYLSKEEIQNVRIVRKESGYTLIEVTLENGENYIVESD